MTWQSGRSVNNRSAWASTRLCGITHCCSAQCGMYRIALPYGLFCSPEQCGIAIRPGLQSGPPKAAGHGAASGCPALSIHRSCPAVKLPSHAFVRPCLTVCAFCRLAWGVGGMERQAMCLRADWGMGQSWQEAGKCVTRCGRRYCPALFLLKIRGILSE